MFIRAITMSILLGLVLPGCAQVEDDGAGYCEGKCDDPSDVQPDAGGLALDIECQEASEEVATIYDRSCAYCHEEGALGAPMRGDFEAWQPRLDKGVDSLLDSIHNGLDAMPPQGFCFDCTDDQYVGLIEHMCF